MEEEIQELFDEFRQNTVNSLEDFSNQYYDLDITDPEFQQKTSFCESHTGADNDICYAVWEYIENKERLDEVKRLRELKGNNYKPRKSNKQLRDKFLNNAH